MTEITDINVNEEGIGVLFFDGTCRICAKWAARLERWLNGKGLKVLPFEDGAAQDEMRLILNDGQELGGADVVYFLAGKLWWALPLRGLACLPGGHFLMRKIYRKIASNRYCIDGRCDIDQGRGMEEMPVTVKPGMSCFTCFILTLIFLVMVSMYGYVKIQRVG